MDGFNSAQSQPHYQQQQSHSLANPVPAQAATANPNASNPAQKYNFQGVPGCVKCNGTGFKVSKKADGKQKLCSACLEVKGVCPKCNGTGFKIGKPDKACKCKEKASKKSSKGDKEKKSKK